MLTKACGIKFNISWFFNTIFYTIFQQEFSAFAFQKKTKSTFTQRSPFTNKPVCLANSNIRVVAVVLMYVKSLRDWATHKTIPCTTHTHTHSVWRSKSKLYRRQNLIFTGTAADCMQMERDKRWVPSGRNWLSLVSIVFNGIVINVDGSLGWFLLEWILFEYSVSWIIITITLLKT